MTWISTLSSVEQKLMLQNQRLLQHLNTERHCQNEAKQLLSEILGYQLAKSSEIRLPFYTDYGRKIQIAKDVFINCNVIMSDIGGITIDQGGVIGPGVSLLTCDCDQKIGPIKIEKGVKIGGRAIILPGITIGSNAEIKAGAVVTKDVLRNTVMSGNPAKRILEDK
ncbi:maltose O-acetyltransferase [Companilactobacillus crustorum]|uniref:Maltose o-acetyltransferase n=3 Tax=Companilactobacillus TaxID=2767879 RepID=A0A837RH30_9LACO|nr:DapH/DapD/GlmU-related protein [Companilactobacillus crustorum]KRK41259.1 maltose o-acetyltransferase [Companilactobacillus crustorum JCM 15951]KRO18150.1 maltose o-acetyltransferase [Companilactobacillus crustorum]GEO77442.1 maltose O-acetyltransferase [Companilactobacillus crustorum]